jgi:hypothetical protein
VFLQGIRHRGFLQVAYQQLWIVYIFIINILRDSERFGFPRVDLLIVNVRILFCIRNRKTIKSNFTFTNPIQFDQNAWPCVQISVLISSNALSEVLSVHPTSGLVGGTSFIVVAIDDTQGSIRQINLCFQFSYS